MLTERHAPSLDDIAREARLPRSVAVRAVGGLRALGWLEMDTAGRRRARTLRLIVWPREEVDAAVQREKARESERAAHRTEEASDVLAVWIRRENEG
jgi:DNA-binding IclR family transcriptional regulator